jgi:hypothetical protein
MGFLKKILYILLFIPFLVIFSGCAKSVIKIISQKDDSPVSQFAEVPERNFFIPVTLSDNIRLLWENDVHGSFNNSSFLFYDSTVIIHDLGGRIHAYNIHIGKQTGVLKYKGAVFSTPLIFGFNIVTALVINNENKTELIFYDFFNGKELKLIEIEGKVTNQMLKIGDDLILITENGIVKRINSKGSEIWSKQLSSFIHSTPAYSDGKIYFGNDAGEFIALDFESSEIILKKKIGDSFNSGVTIKNSLGYISDDKGTLYAINLKDASIKWSYETRARILMNAALDVENVFIANLAGSIFAINKNSGELVWTRNYNGEVFNSTPLITNNRVIISSLFKSVMILDKSNGEIKKEIELDNRAKLTPAIRHNILFIGYDNGNVRAYEILD